MTLVVPQIVYSIMVTIMLSRNSDSRKQLTDAIARYMNGNDFTVLDENFYRTTTRLIYDELGWEGMHKSDLDESQLVLLDHVEFVTARLIERKRMCPHTAARQAVALLG